MNEAERRYFIRHSGQYRTEQSDDKRWWYTIQYSPSDPMGEIVGSRFGAMHKARDQTREFKKLAAEGKNK